MITIHFNAVAFVLLFARTAGLLVLLPPMLGIAIPVQVRLMLSAVLAGALLPIARLAQPIAPGPLGTALLLMRELMLGVLLAFAASLVVGAALMAGELLGNSMEINTGGLLRGTVLSPNVLGDSLAAFTALLFFVGGFHRALLIALGRSLRFIPLGGVWLPHLGDAVRLGGEMFVLAVELALPLLIPLLLLAVAQGVLARLAPQINMLVAAPAAVALAGMVLLLLDSHGLAADLMRDWTRVTGVMMVWMHG